MVAPGTHFDPCCRHTGKGFTRVATKTRSKKAHREKTPAKYGTKVRTPSLEYANVLAHAVETFGSKTRADSWLNKPNRVFHYKTPLQALITDAPGVEEELVRIDHGIYV